MEKNLVCASCGCSKEIEFNSMQDVVDNGFNFIWDVSNGLRNVNLCGNCAEEVEKHVHAIEDIVKIEIGYLNFGRMSKLDSR